MNNNFILGYKHKETIYEDQSRIIYYKIRESEQRADMIKCFQAEDLTLEEITQLQDEYKEYKIIKS